MGRTLTTSTYELSHVEQAFRGKAHNYWADVKVCRICQGFADTLEGYLMDTPVLVSVQDLNKCRDCGRFKAEHQEHKCPKTTPPSQTEGERE